MLRWELTDLAQGNVLSLPDRHSGSVELARNSARTATTTISTEDPGAQRALVPLRTLLRVWLDGLSDPLFIGRLHDPVFGPDTVELRAVDPWFSLERAYTRAFKPVAGLLTKDQSEYMALAVEHVADRDHGIVRGSLPATLQRNRHYQDGRQIAQILTEISELVNGPDFELYPVEATDGTLVRLNTFARQGVRRPARFEYGHGAHNVGGFSFEPSGIDVCNKFTAIGERLTPERAPTGFGYAEAYTAQSASSQAHYGGVFEQFVSVSESAGIGELEAIAREQVRRYAFAPSYFDLTTPPERGSEGWESAAGEGVEYGVAPQFGGEYWIGDEIVATAKGAIDVEMIGRVEAVAVSDNAQGHVTVKTTCSPASIEATDVTGEAWTAYLWDREST